MDVYNLQTGQILSTLYSVAHAQVLELKVPLALLDSPGSLSVHAFVMAQNNGQEQVIKGFQGDAQVICPRYDVCLPLILRNP
jgi:hypothetical protein